MTWWQALILGLVQGLTEFLPISSSGHLSLVQSALGLHYESLAFEVAVHLGTLVAVIVYFFKDLAKVFVEFFKGGEGRKIGLMLILAMVPTGIIGMLIKISIGDLMKNPAFAATGLLFTTVFLFLAEKMPKGEYKLEDINWKRSLFVGTIQGIAVLPGISRSGSTIMMGLAQGMSRDTAARFSFLLAVPAIMAAGVVTAKDFTSIPSGELFPFAIGIIASMISGYAAIDILMRVLRTGKLYGFAIYTFIVGLASLVIFGN